MSKTLVPFAAALVVLALAAAAPAAAAAASPYDAGPLGTAQSLVPILPTGLFPLGFDMSSVGVDPSELTTAGPVSSTSTPSSTNMLIVDDNGLDCPNAQFTTIQAAVDAATPGAMIKVCRGTYREQVTIPAGKDGLTLFSVPDLGAVITTPLTPMNSPKALVLVTGAHNVTIRHFTISGPGLGGCDSLEYGVRVDAGGSALITDNHITHIRDPPFSGCQNGVGVLIGRNSECTFGFGTVVHNLIDDYQKGGVVVDGQLPDRPDCGGIGFFAATTAPPPVSNAEVAYNEIDGIGQTPLIAQNGIQVSRGAIANVHHNVVKDNLYTGPDADEGILLYQDSQSMTTINHNDVYNNNVGIGLFTTSNIEVGWNRSHDNTPYDGIFADADTANNTIEHNLLSGNAEFDCDDISAGTYNAPALVANPWIQDLGYTENRAGLCKHASP